MLIQSGDLLDWISVPLSFVGVWPLKNTYFRFASWILYLVLHLIMAYADLVAVFGNIELMVLNFSSTSVQSTILVRIIIFRYSKLLAPLVLAVKEDMRPQNYETREEMLIYSRYYSSAVWFFKIAVSSITITGIIYYLMPLQEYMITGKV